ncbi:sn-glycerol 3-phosphate transport system permease protein [Paenibacillus sp. 1_12]|uniref:carbohydrate ABC transporter permease n=1 Tax=Paenibacillus sp. 1_12 TaxID=1566278 RepID=UPI0008E985B6|nr:sugar ABC transporter permease [Paenibacillus sp. 1_12]SFM30602.1 sn-glycerol 3-phosphate transport system permease protein [Paenibacillus sp. 1_12]
MSLRSQKWKEVGLAYCFLLPSIVLFSVFMFYPMIRSVYLSFHLTNPRGIVAMFVGLENFIDIFRTGAFFESLQVTALFMLYTVPTGIILSLVMVALTHNKLKGMSLFQWIFSMPIVISVATGSAIWLLLFHPSIGMLNYYFGLLGIQPVFWLSNPSWALFSVSLMTIWMNSGFSYIVLLGGIKGISPEIYESALIDGANARRMFFNITMPLLSPTFFFLSIVSIIGSFQAFGQIHILTKGGPSHSTDVVVYSIYQEAFVNFQFGTASAKALVLFVIIMLLTVIQFRFAEKKVHYQ